MVMNRGETAGNERIRLILADDARQLLELERSFFPEDEFEVSLAHNGCEAYNLVKVIEPAVVFLDLFMPMLNGEECCRLIKSDPRLRDVRVVLIATDEERQVRRCHDAQCDLVLIKPIRRRDFIGAVQSIVEHCHHTPSRWPARISAELHDTSRCRLHTWTWTVNLSEKGAYLESEERLHLGSIFTLRLHAGENELSIPAQIIWLNPGEAPRDRRLPPGFGVRFLEFKGETRLLLRTLLGEPAASSHGSSWGSSQASRSMFVELPMLTGRRL